MLTGFSRSTQAWHLRCRGETDDVRPSGGCDLGEVQVRVSIEQLQRGPVAREARPHAGCVLGAVHCDAPSSARHEEEREERLARCLRDACAGDQKRLRHGVHELGCITRLPRQDRDPLLRREACMNVRHDAQDGIARIGSDEDRPATL